MQHFCLIALLISSGSATAQLSPTFSFGDGETTLTFSQQPSEPNFAFTGVPYTATQSINQTQTLSTGAHVNQKTTFVSIWQDADGRKRTDQQYALPRGNDVVVSQILDPVEGAIYLLEPALSIAHRVKISARVTQIHPNAAPPANRPFFTKTNADGSTFTIETIGTQVLAGLTTYGTRTTTHYPAGSSIGNDQPIDSLKEFWTSPQIGAMLLLKIQDPRYGDSTLAFDNVTPGEPDASLLKPPAGYRIVDETGSFQIKVSQLP